jgi:hypothetical protein
MNLDAVAIAAAFVGGFARGALAVSLFLDCSARFSYSTGRMNAACARFAPKQRSRSEGEVLCGSPRFASPVNSRAGARWPRARVRTGRNRRRHGTRDFFHTAQAKTRL